SSSIGGRRESQGITRRGDGSGGAEQRARGRSLQPGYRVGVGRERVLGQTRRRLHQVVERRLGDLAVVRLDHEPFEVDGVLHVVGEQRLQRPWVAAALV